MTISTRPITNTSIGQPTRTPPAAELDRHRADAGTPDEAGVDQADQRDEEADADADRDLELRGHGVEHRLAEAGQHQHQDDHALEDDQAHRVGPGHARGDRERHERVEPEAGRQRERVVGHDAHQDGEHAGDERGGRGDACEVAAAEQLAVGVRRRQQDDRVQHDDVGHREEGDDAAADLAAERGASLGDLEERVHSGTPRTCQGRMGQRGRPTGLPRRADASCQMRASRVLLPAPRPLAVIRVGPACGRLG